MKNISILGVTGSIGSSALNVIDHYPGAFSLVGVSSHRNIEKLFAVIDHYHPRYAVCTDALYFHEYFKSYEAEYHGVPIYSGEEGLLRICQDTRNELVLNAIAGKSGLKPSVDILQSGISLALANKESVVCAGELLFTIANQYRGEIIPVDSEHSALFSLLSQKKRDTVKYVHITASGGPFLHRDKATWDTITLADALKHPTWSMGKKISIDSATMANKGLEVIEAHYLFDIGYDKINVLVHPQSLIHSMVECIDGEVYAQIGPKDMSIPIQNALFYPEIMHNTYSTLDFSAGISLELQPVDYTKFRMLDFAYECGRKKGGYPAFYNYVNEYLVDLFVKGEITFTGIEKYMELALTSAEKRGDLPSSVADLAALHYIDTISKKIVHEITRG